MFRFLMLFFFSWALLAGPVHAAKRALVIGNDAYDELPSLKKAVADARAYADVLLDLGYEVTLNEDLSTLEMQRALGGFIDSVEPGDEVAFVYAGHGWSDGSTNYMIGGDTEMQTSIATLRRSAIPIENGANGVIDDLRTRGARVVLAVLDACRTNPFQSKNGRSGSVGLSRGLVLLTPVSGTFTVFSAGAGEEALDRLDENDTNPNSVFSRVFLQELRSGGNLQDMVLNTAPRVASLAKEVGHAQRPSYYDGIGERYCLTDDCGAAISAKSTTDAPLPVIESRTPAPAVETPSLVENSPLPVTKPVSEQTEIVLLPQPNPPSAESTISIAVEPETTIIAAPSTPEPDPYFLPDPVQLAIPQPAQIASPALTGAPVQFIVRSASPIRRLAQLDRESICTVARTPQQATIENYFASRQKSHHNRKFPNLKRAIIALEKSRCGAIAVPPRLISHVISTVRDPSRYVVLPEVVR